jgi:fermentation-respiration switch protein FrsA (DUF1100 family)
LKTISRRPKPFGAIRSWCSCPAARTEDQAAFLAQQKQFLSGTFQVDEATGLMIYVPHFQHMLARVNVPVLAIFGEKDRNVNWRNTVPLYSKTIGKNPNASLTIKTFADGNHNLQQAREIRRFWTDGHSEAIQKRGSRRSERQQHSVSSHFLQRDYCTGLQDKTKRLMG